MAVKYLCDMCDHEVREHGDLYRLHIAAGAEYEEIEYDICNVCRGALAEYLSICDTQKSKKWARL